MHVDKFTSYLVLDKLSYNYYVHTTFAHQIIIIIMLQHLERETSIISEASRYYSILTYWTAISFRAFHFHVGVVLQQIQSTVLKVLVLY